MSERHLQAVPPLPDPESRRGAPVAPPGRLSERLTRVLGPRTADVLGERLDLHTVGDLLWHLPRRYVQHGELTDLRSIELGEHVTVFAEVVDCTTRRMRERRGFITEVVVTDGRGTLSLTFFNQKYREDELHRGVRGMFAGKVSAHNRRRQLLHPDYLLRDLADAEDLEAFARDLVPIYRACAQMPSWKIARAVRTVLDTLHELDDPLPQELRERHGLVGLLEALRLVHQPRTMQDWERGRDRLRWDEAFTLQVVLAQRRAASRALPGTPRRPVPGGLLDAFDARLPFRLTEGQQDVCAQILDDLAREHPMHRLLQGEVGAGKTVVALRAMLAVVDSGGQAALLAPTEVLAQQHHRSIRTLLGPLAESGMLGGDERGTRVALLTGSQPTAARRAALLDAASGQAGIVVGTHALLQERVDFADLGLVVVDEQHRFGVEQRDALRAKAERPPHVLVMTATPIPRTVAMTVFGDLDVSTLAELPRGRSPIATHVVPVVDRPHFLDRAWERVREEVAAGRQAYVVCPRIGDGEAPPRSGRGGADEGDDGLEPVADDDEGRRAPLAALDVAAMLAEGPLHGLRIAVLHGRLAPDEKDAVMAAFVDGVVDVLVATTVIEVGVDVPNATAMVVMDAERFGVSQLHQLRGRVGRGAAPGVALLVTEAPQGSPSRERLEAVAATLDGFELSRIDLESRREGDVLGAAQSGGRSSLRVLQVVRDEEVIALAREEATALVDADPDLTGHPALRATLDALLDTERAEYLEKG